MSSILPLRQLLAPSPSDPNPLVIYHGSDCPDGFAAALAAWTFFEGQAEFRAQDHGEVKVAQDINKLPPLAGRAVYILDFSFDREVMAVIDAQAARLVVLDHHLSAQQALDGFVCRCGGVHFDLKKSGARLAWEFFQPDVPLPDLVKFVEDRDLWAWRFPQSAGFLAALDMEPQDFARWTQIARFNETELTTFMARGQAMDEKFTKLAHDIADSARAVVFNGQTGLMVNAPSVFHSLIGNILSEKTQTFALMWTVNKAGAVKVGLRSQRNFDCIPLANSMGGGGHAQASAFKMPVQRLAELLTGVFNAA
jgi:uncharacterized protein